MPRRADFLIADGGLFRVGLECGAVLAARSVVLATGARYRTLGLDGEEAFAGAGLHYAATEVEARPCRGHDVVVVGAGNSAGQAAMFLSETARTVHVVCRGPDLGRTMSRYLVSRLERAPNVRIRTRSVVAGLEGGGRLEVVAVAEAGGPPERVTAHALFAMIGADPRTGWLRGAVALDAKGFVVTGPDLAGAGFASGQTPFCASLPGVFAVGDVRSGSVKRVASAVGEGAVVVQAVHRYLASAREAAGLGDGAAVGIAAGIDRGGG